MLILEVWDFMLLFLNIYELPLVTSYFVGSTVEACKSSGRHIVAFEEDAEIFKALLAPHRQMASTDPASQKRKAGRRAQGEPSQKKQKSNRILSCE